MRSSFSPKVVTANDLVNGDVVYLSADRCWVPYHKDAELFLDEARAEMQLAYAETQQSYVVGAYLADAVASTSGPAPVHFREVFRAHGPSNLFHGKQAELAHVSV